MKFQLAALLTLVLFPAAAQERFAAFSGPALAHMQAHAHAPDAAFRNFADLYLQAREKRTRARGEELGACIDKEGRQINMLDLDGDGRDEGLIVYAWINCGGGNYSASSLDVLTLGRQPQYAGSVDLGTSLVGFGDVTQIGKSVIKVSGDAGKLLAPRSYRLKDGRLK